ncbi:MAG: D-alanine--D-alanine ligase, partial [Verrucomicrobia bacterium]|nr:D-alanine--D-alanine ligase [Cytophagales bacterium]
MKLRIGIIFGGNSREREISFAGGRTVYDNLNKNLFEAVPVFTDSLGNFILLDWQFVYKGTIRDFYPPIDFLPPSPHSFQVYIESLGKLSDTDMHQLISKVGRKIEPSEFKHLFDFAFLTLHGPYGEDGNIQGLLEWYGVPYSGAGILPSAVGIDKKVQQSIFGNAGILHPKGVLISRSAWKSNTYKGDIFEDIIGKLGMPFVIKPPRQGSSIGVAVMNEKDNMVFAEAVNKAFFIQEISSGKWHSFSEHQKIQFIHDLTDIRSGMGLPVWVNNQILLYHPEELVDFLEKVQGAETMTILESVDGESEILFETFIEGKEFSCIVIEDENHQPIALPPTEVRKKQSVFDYRSKYLPGMSRKITPIEVPDIQIEQIRKACCQLYEAMYGDVYARIDGFITSSGEIYLNDPNTTSGMMPSGFFFHQAAEIGLNPSQFITY